MAAIRSDRGPSIDSFRQKRELRSLARFDERASERVRNSVMLLVRSGNRNETAGIYR